MNPNDWKQNGRVSIWSYEGKPRNYPGWHLNCDEAGALSLMRLVASLANSPELAKRTVSVTRPVQEQLAVPNCSAKPRAPEKLVLEVSSKWFISEAKDKVVLGFPAEMAIELESGLRSLSQGDGDYYIGEKGSELWFWW